MNEAAGDAGRVLRELVAVLQLEKLARGARERDALAFLIVNDTRRAVPFDQAVLFVARDDAELTVRAVSGVSKHAADAPQLQSLSRLVNRSRGELGGDEPLVLGRERIDAGARTDWDAIAPANPLWVPLSDTAGNRVGGIWLTRDAPWRQAEVMQLGFLGNAFAHAWSALGGQRREPIAWRSLLRSRRTLSRVAIGVLVVMLFPVRQSAIAPAEIAARNPWIVSPPVEGVIDSIEVQPNDAVKKDQLLFSLDPRLLRNRHEVALKALEVARADYERAVQKAFSNPDSKAEITVLKAVAEQRAAEVKYTGELLERIRVRAPADGIVAFSDPHDWLGRPVSVGEKIMTIADPRDVELLIWLPVNEAINLEPGARIEAFLNSDPAHTLRATLRLASYTAEASHDQVLSYRIRAPFDEERDELPRIGLQATAKIYGRRVTLFYYIFRRPLAQLRHFSGL